MSIRFNKSKCGCSLVYRKGMTTSDCIIALQKRIDNREKSLSIYEPFYKKYLSLRKMQDDELAWLLYLKDTPNFIEGDEIE